MKKVLLISNKIYHYRVPIYNYFGNRFKQEGYELYLVANELQPNFDYYAEVKYKIIPFNFIDYKNEIKHLNPDVVILFLHLKDTIIWPLIYWLSWKRIPIIYWTHGVNLQDPNNIFKNILFKYLHRKVDAILLYSNVEKRHISSKNLYKVYVAPNTLNFNAFPEIEKSRHELKKELNFGYEKMVLFPARSDPRRKLDMLLRVFENFKDSKVGLLIVGSKEADHTYQFDIEKSPAIKFLGVITDQIKFNKIMKASDVVCIPGKSGLAINQAFYWGVPFITTNVKQSPEVVYIKDGFNGYIIDQNNFIDFEDKLLTLLFDDNLNKQFSLNAKKVIDKEGCIEAMFTGFNKAVNGVLNKKLLK